jgi:hypothetical protein
MTFECVFEFKNLGVIELKYLEDECHREEIDN